MPLQNRVTPFGEIVAIPQRGMFTGNRGIIHDPATKTLLNRRWSSKAWLICRCDYKDVRRDVMATRSWTELFFLDEATALAAGHRPCFYCRRAAAESFRAAWAAARGIPKPSASAMDAVLHAERIENGRKRIHRLDVKPSALPDGAMVVFEKRAYLIVGELAYPWTDSVYGRPDNLRDADGLLTPPSAVAAIQAGFRALVHPTASLGLPTECREGT
ncbi:MAG TPA: hypothetical protein VI485_27710 [Vicinamibacterales bacterium]|nr:hypothetical protein [Vicinamibacterales bacterium]